MKAQIEQKAQELRLKLLEEALSLQGAITNEALDDRLNALRELTYILNALDPSTQGAGLLMGAYAKDVATEALAESGR